MQIRTRLLFLVLSTLIPSFLASVLAIWFVYGKQADAQKKAVTEATRALALLIDNELETTQGILRTLANSPALTQNDMRAFYEHARSMAPPAYSAVVLTDLSGKQLLNTRLPFGAELPQSGSNLMALRQQYDADQTIVSDLFFAPVGKRYDFAVQIPVMRDRQVRYYLSMGLAAAQLQSLLARAELPSGWLGVVIDRQGVVVARSAEPEKFVGRQVGEPLRKKIIAFERQGIHYGTTLDGIRTAGFFSRAPHSEWTVIINVPLTEMRQPALYAAAILGAIMFTLMIGAIATARWYAKRTAEPIERLRHAAARLGRGEVITVEATGLVETDAVSIALANASTQLQQGKADLERRVAEAVTAAERAQRALLQSQKLEALGRLTAGIAHDFNNVLQTLSTALQLIYIGANQPRTRELVDTCNRAIERATVLTGQMRSFGKVQDASMETIRVEQRIQALSPMLKNILPAHITLDLQVDSALWPVTMDALQFELALLNLVINARDAMPNGGVVQVTIVNTIVAHSIETLKPGEYIEITIADNGVGMSREVLSKALDPFFTTKGVDKGSGLGLPQAYGFAKQAQGTLVLHSEEGQGTTVTIYLPRATTEVHEVVRKGRDAPKLSVSGVLLFVEDDPLVREAVAPALGHAGFEVVLAADGEQALAVLESGRAIDLVFSDIVMPGQISGIDLARIIKERFPAVQVILASGYTDNRVNLEGVRLLAKPYNIHDVIRILSQTV